MFTGGLAPPGPSGPQVRNARNSGTSSWSPKRVHAKRPLAQSLEHQRFRKAYEHDTEWMNEVIFAIEEEDALSVKNHLGVSAQMLNQRHSAGRRGEIG